MALLCSVPLQASALAADLLVPSQYPTIQSAVQAAQDGDRVLIAAGDYTEVVNLLGKSIELAPAVAAGEVNLRAPASQRALRFVSGESSACRVRGLRLVGSLPAGTLGGGIEVMGASPRIEDCIVEGVISSPSAGTWGGALDVISGAPVMKSTIFRHNRVSASFAVDGGAALVRGGAAYFEDCLFVDNPSGQGSDLFLVNNGLTTATLTGCRFEGVSGGGFGARIYNYGQGGGAATLVLSNCVFSGIVQQAISLVHGWDAVQMNAVRFEDCAVTGYPKIGAPGCLISQSRSPLLLRACEFVANSANHILCIDPAQGGIAQAQSSRFCGNLPLGPDFGPTVIDLGGNTVRSSCCPGDITGNGTVNGLDLAAILAAWGTDGQGKFDCDVDNDGIVNGADLATVLSAWGPCPN
jgi:hypothetical protein